MTVQSPQFWPQLPGRPSSLQLKQSELLRLRLNFIDPALGKWLCCSSTEDCTEIIYNLHQQDLELEENIEM